ncbi:solute carrier family 35, member F1/2 [Trypanosoma grayi]|uniref:solute carrier family 35, member F1/2 n=1 Tax=Trypanosoma grayi TaxID=71804 RepID=UPI0004F42510|nr:solute carrier family 35, member F1/2 [Trypanosoma grayi]KEG08828.1 solute carrier family 35, member F1/2 [Trypanosoma grayi]
MRLRRVKQVALHVVVGQAVALLNSLTGVSTNMLVENDASYPSLQCVTAYACIFVVYCPLFLFMFFLHRHREYSNFTFFHRPWKYAMLGLIDMEANFVIVKAYPFTDMVSAQLLGCFTIPCVLLMSYFIFKMRFSITHIAGCVIATGGLALLIVLDADGISRDSDAPSAVKGDMLCLLSAVLYAVSNVLTEYFIKPQPRVSRSDENELVGGTQEAESVIIEMDAGRHLSVKPQLVGACPKASCSPNTIPGAEREQKQRVIEACGEILPEVPKYIPIMENLFCMSGCALVFATIQFFAVEWKTFSPARETWTNRDWLFQMMFGLTMLCVYTGLPILFLIASAAFANISLLAVSIIWYNLEHDNLWSLSNPCVLCIICDHHRRCPAVRPLRHSLGLVTAHQLPLR